MSDKLHASLMPFAVRACLILILILILTLILILILMLILLDPAFLNPLYARVVGTLESVFDQANFTGLPL